MNERLNSLVGHLRETAEGGDIDALSTGEACYVALAANRYDLLPTIYPDPIEAWNRLDRVWRLAVCEWRGWPETYASGG